MRAAPCRVRLAPDTVGGRGRRRDGAVRRVRRGGHRRRVRRPERRRRAGTRRSRGPAAGGPPPRRRPRPDPLPGRRHPAGPGRPVDRPHPAAHGRPGPPPRRAHLPHTRRGRGPGRVRRAPPGRAARRGRRGTGLARPPGPRGPAGTALDRPRRGEPGRPHLRHLAGGDRRPARRPRPGGTAGLRRPPLRRLRGELPPGDPLLRGERGRHRAAARLRGRGAGDPVRGRGAAPRGTHGLGAARRHAAAGRAGAHRRVRPGRGPGPHTARGGGRRPRGASPSRRYWRAASTTPPPCPRCAPACSSACRPGRR